MRFNIIFLAAFLFINPLTNQFNYRKYRPAPKIKLPSKIKKSFKEKKNFYFYRSVITGQKWGLDKKLKKRLSHLNLMHLMTPSGLHLSSLFLIFFLIRRRFKRPTQFIELVMCFIFYFFLPGYYSFRRVALLRSFFILNDIRKTNYTKMQIFIFFLITDFLFGTYRFGHLSFYLSTLFLALIFSIKDFRVYKMYLLFFVAQLFIAHKFSGVIYPASVILSPLLTSLFTLVYPILFLNLFFIKIWNYSEVLIIIYTKLVEFCFDIANSIGFIHVNFLILIGIIIYTRKSKNFSLALITIGLISDFPRDGLQIILNEIGIGL
ncbi:ComEC/Rec2 family competence protein [Halobacteriovorax sp. YZS-1-1]|uniref:ComEC/Rec2 family competence protein n=1 Tax=unclassified Halobacteriovorax TaxID=2639665 RepID=UPI00399BE05B